MLSRRLRQIAALLTPGVRAPAGCGAEPPPDVPKYYLEVLDFDDPTPHETGTGLSWSTLLEPPPEIPTYEPPVLDRADLDARLATLSPSDKALFDHYEQATGHDQLGEGTWILAAPMTVDEARMRLLGPNPRRGANADIEDAHVSEYFFLQVGDGVVAWEYSGFAGPPRRLLAELSRDGAVSAVATDNLKSIIRFGYARDGEVIFDASEYIYVDDLNEIPAEVRELAALVLDGPDDEDVEVADEFAVAMAMCEKVTGVRATADVQGVSARYVVPMHWGPEEDGWG